MGSKDISVETSSKVEVRIGLGLRVRLGLGLGLQVEWIGSGTRAGEYIKSTNVLTKKVQECAWECVCLFARLVVKTALKCS